MLEESHFQWLTNGKVSARGLGMKVQEGVAIGWRRIAD